MPQRRGGSGSRPGACAAEWRDKALPVDHQQAHAHIGELTEIREEADGTRVGAGITLQQLAEYETVRHSYRAVSEAAGSVAGPTHRAYGTVGGNLCLDTRCLFYNQSEWWRSSNAYCLKRRGEVCHVAPGGSVC